MGAEREENRWAVFKTLHQADIGGADAVVGVIPERSYFRVLLCALFVAGEAD